MTMIYDNLSIISIIYMLYVLCFEICLLSNLDIAIKVSGVGFIVFGLILFSIIFNTGNPKCF